VAFGRSLLRLLKTFANRKEPMAEKSQPRRLTLPKAARAAGIRNTPAPIMFPTTREVAVQSPSFLVSGGVMGWVYQGKIQHCCRITILLVIGCRIFEQPRALRLMRPAFKFFVFIMVRSYRRK